jgi:hypothetical protein
MRFLPTTSPTRLLLASAAAAALTLACTSGAAPEVTSTNAPSSTPLSTASPLATPTANPRIAERAAERAAVLAELRSTPGVADVIAAFEAREVATLLAQMYRHRGFCEWPVPAILPAEPSHLARAACYGEEVRYRGVDVGGSALEGGTGSLWQSVAAGSLLAQLLLVENEWQFGSVQTEHYRHIVEENADGRVEERTRYLVRFFVDRPAQLRLPWGQQSASEVSFVIDIGGEAELRLAPIVSLTVDDAKTNDQRVSVSVDRRGATHSSDVSPSVRARIGETAELASLFAALADLDALLAQFDTTEAHCQHLPRPGKEGSELCELIGDPPDDRYDSATLDFGVLFPISTDRLRVMLTPMFAAETGPPIVGAWHLDASVAPEGSERYLVALGGPLLESTGRDDHYSFGSEWDAVMLVIDPAADAPIEYLTLLSPDSTAESKARTFDRLRNGLTDLARP